MILNVLEIRSDGNLESLVRLVRMLILVKLVRLVRLLKCEICVTCEPGEPNVTYKHRVRNTEIYLEWLAPLRNIGKFL